MPVYNKQKYSFLAGELSPYLEGRADFDRFDESCELLENWIVLPQGAITKCPGWRYAGATLDSTLAADSAYAAAGLGYNYSLTQQYSLVFSEEAPTTVAQTLTLSALKGPLVTATAGGGTPFATANNPVGKTIECFAGGFTGKLFITDRVSDTVVKGEVVTAFNHGLSGDAITSSNWRLNAGYFQVYKTDPTTLVPALVVTSPTKMQCPYDAATLYKLRGEQQGSVLYLFHPNYPPCKIVATSETAWTFQKVKFLPPPVTNLAWYMPTSSATGYTVTLNAQSGVDKTATLSGGSGYGWLGGDGNRVLRAGTGRAIIDRKSTDSGTVSTIDIINDFDATVYGPGDWWLEGSPRGLLTITPTYPAAQFATVTVTCERNAFRTGDAPNGDVGKYIRVHGNLIKIVKFISATAVKGYIVSRFNEGSTFQNTSTGGHNFVPTRNWELLSEAWNCDYGYPSCGALYEQRLFAAGAPGWPYAIWGSWQAQLENFAMTANNTAQVIDEAGIDWQFNSTSLVRIVWLLGSLTLIGGTDGGEFHLNAASQGGALTAKDFNLSSQSANGSANVAAVKSSYGVFYAGQDGTTVRELSFDPQGGGIVDIDRGVHAAHLFSSPVAQFAVQSAPYSLIWVRTSAGTLRAMTYLPDQKTYAWQRRTAASIATGDGVCESIWTIRSAGWTELWAVFKRKINGYWVRYVERMDKIDPGKTYADALMCDAGKTWTHAGSATVTGMSHLKGRTDVVALYTRTADGVLGVATGLTVNASGETTLPASATKAQVGLPYTADFINCKIRIPQPDGATAQAIPKHIIGLNLMLRDCGPLNISDGWTTSTPIAIPLVTGSAWTAVTADDDLWATMPSGFDNAGLVRITSDKPWPATVLSLVIQTEIETR